MNITVPTMQEFPRELAFSSSSDKKNSCSRPKQSTGWFLASPEALEVIVVSYSLPPSLIVRTDLTDVTLVSDDTY